MTTTIGEMDDVTQQNAALVEEAAAAAGAMQAQARELARLVGSFKLDGDGDGDEDGGPAVVRLSSLGDIAVN